MRDLEKEGAWVGFVVLVWVWMVAGGQSVRVDENEGDVPRVRLVARLEESGSIPRGGK